MPAIGTTDNLIARVERERPACQAIADDLRTQVVAGRLAAGTRLPSHRHLASSYRVAIGTIQQAVARLVAEGILVTEANRGLYVASPARRSAGESLRPTETPALNAHIGIISPLATMWDETYTLRIVDPNERRPPTIEAMERALGDLGSSTAFRDTGGHEVDIARNTRQAVAELLAEGVDAITVVFTHDDVITRDVLGQLDTNRVPVVLAVSERCRVTLPRVCYDGRVAAQRAADHLFRQGCERVVYFAPFVADWSIERYMGAQDAARLLGLDAASVIACQGSDSVSEMLAAGTIDDTEQQAKFAAGFASARLPKLISGVATGIVAHNDHAALGFISAASERGFVAGKDYLIIGFDDIKGARSAGLSSMRPPFGDMGRECAKLVSEALVGPLTPRQISLQSHLIIRDSSRNQIVSGEKSHELL